MGECSVTALLDAVPALGEIDPGACYLAWEISLTTSRPLPEIRETIHLRHKITGKVYSPFGTPFGSKADDFEGISVGYCYVDKNGIGYGTRGKSREELEARYTENQNNKDKEFRAHLEQQCNDKQLQSQAEYWLK